MIIDFFLNVVAYLLQAVVNVLPTFTIFPESLPTLITNFLSPVFGWNWLFPTPVILIVLSIIIVVVFAEFTFFITMYVLSLIHSTIRG